MRTKKWARKLRKISAEVNFTKRFGLEDGRVFNRRVAQRRCLKFVSYCQGEIIGKEVNLAQCLAQYLIGYLSFVLMFY